MNPALMFRRAQASEAELLTNAAIEAKRFWGYPDEWMAEWRPELTVTSEYIETQPVFIAEVESEVVGFFGLGIAESGCRLEHLWVRPVHIGRGFGCALFAEAVAQARSAGMTKLQMKSDPNAEKFYSRMGAVRSGVENYQMRGGAHRSVPVLIYVIS